MAGIWGAGTNDILKAAIRGGISAGVANKVGHAGLGGYKPVAHAATQAALSAAFGGSTGEIRGTFLSALAGQIPTGGLGPEGQVVLSMLVGGFASELGGGEFVDGALTAAFVRLFNDLQHENRFQQSKYKGSCHGYDGSYQTEVNVSTGWHGSLSALNPLTSGGGDVIGYNEQKFYEDGSVVMRKFLFYSTDAGGYEVGASAENIWALGAGGWGGEFNSLNGGFLWFSGSIFWSRINPTNGEGWIGFSYGVSKSVGPSLSTQRTNYVEID